MAFGGSSYFQTYNLFEALGLPGITVAFFIPDGKEAKMLLPATVNEAIQGYCQLHWINAIYLFYIFLYVVYVYFLFPIYNIILIAHSNVIIISRG